MPVASMAGRERGASGGLFATTGGTRTARGTWGYHFQESGRRGGPYSSASSRGRRVQWEEEGEEEEGEEEEIVDEEEEGGGSSEEEEENEEGEEEEAGEEDDESQDVSIRSQNRGNERGELAFELSGILTEGGLCSEKEAAHIVHGRLELQAEEQSIELHPAWIARARRTENKSVDSQAISFSLHRDVRKEEAMGIKALKNRLIFRIDGASSNCVRNAWYRSLLLPYALAVQCSVLAPALLLRTRCAMLSTDEGFAARMLRGIWYCPRVCCYAKAGTDIGYAATRRRAGGVRSKKAG
eukprot:124676-Rhodomonas_salina.2